MYKDNPKYTHKGNYGGIDVYICENAADWHISRYIEAMNWQSFAACGVTKDHLTAITDEILRICNDEKQVKNVRTDIGSLVNVLKYKMRFPVEEKCGVYLGAILSFIEYEDNGNVISEPDERVDNMFIRKKIELADKYPEAYAFFLTWGSVNIPEYKEHLALLTDTEYLTSREEQIKMLLPKHLQRLKQ